MRHHTKAFRILHFALCISQFAFAAAIADEPLRPATMPWDTRELFKAPAFEWVDEKSPVRSLLYESAAFGEHKATRVFAYYATPGTLAGDPALDKNLPAVVLIHGGGGTAFAEWAELWAKRGYAAIAMDLAGNRPIEGRNPHDGKNRQRLADGGPGQGDQEKFFAIGKPTSEHWCYHAVANAVRAHSLIRSMPGVDAERTAVTGISWGGYLTCIVASIDSRFKAAVPVYGCGYLHENSTWLPQFRKLGEEAAAKWVAMYDPSTYLPMCTVPIFFVNGTNDFAYPLDSWMKSVDAVKGEKHLRVEVNMPHGHQPGWAPKEIAAFVDWKVKGGEPLPTFAQNAEGDPVKGPAHDVKLIVSSQSTVTRVEAISTVQDTAINGRQWTAAALEDGGKPRVLLPLEPVAGATAWFYSATDERGLTVSSPVKVREAGPPIK